jgi:2-oxoisovalerate dehydrogenase E1 component
MASTDTYTRVEKSALVKGYQLMCISRAINQFCEEHPAWFTQSPFSNARGHEAIQIAAGLLLGNQDFVAPYYRDEALLLALGVPIEEMLPLMLGKATSFSSAKTAYPLQPYSILGAPGILFTGEGTGHHLITATGFAQGLNHKARRQASLVGKEPLVVCSVEDSSLSHGEASEAFQMAVLKKLPILYLVQDDDWTGAVPSEEIRAVDAYELAGGFKGLKRHRVNGADFVQAYEAVASALDYIREHRMPVLLHVKAPLLADHSTLLRKEVYRSPENIELHRKDEPLLRLKKYLVIEGESEESIGLMELEAVQTVKAAFQLLQASSEKVEHEQVALIGSLAGNAAFIRENGNRKPDKAPVVTMAQCASRTLEYLLSYYPETLYYGTDISHPLKEEFATWQDKYRPDRVFNLPQMPSYLTGATAGLVLSGYRPVVEIDAEVLASGWAQLSAVLSKYYYLTDGRIQMPVLFRVFCGSQTHSGPFHSLNPEMLLMTLPGIKIAFPSNAADLRGLLNAGFLDPNPVIILEHRELLISGEGACPEPELHYILPLGVATVVENAAEEKQEEGSTCALITYGRGVYLAKEANRQLGQVAEIIDLRSLFPLDLDTIIAAAKRHGKVLLVTEEPAERSFAQNLSAKITQSCFRHLDAPVQVVGSLDVPALPLNASLAKQVLPDVGKIKNALEVLLAS